MLLQGRGGRRFVQGRYKPSFSPLCWTFVLASTEGCDPFGEAEGFGLSGTLCCIFRI